MLYFTGKVFTLVIEIFLDMYYYSRVMMIIGTSDLKPDERIGFSGSELPVP